MVKAMLPYSGDPLTNGHLDVIERGAKMYDQLVVGIGINPEKSHTFTLEEREDMARHCTSHLKNVSVVSYEGLTVHYAYEQCIDVLIKGARDSADVVYEKTLKEIGRALIPDVETALIMAEPDLVKVSSSTVKALQKAQGNVHDYVPLYVKQKLEEKMSDQYIIGITGKPASGKSYISKKFVELGQKLGIPVHDIDLDSIAHNIYERTEPRYVKLRKEIIDRFDLQKDKSQQDVFTCDQNYFINEKTRKRLGEIVFNDAKKLKELNQLLKLPLEVRLSKEMIGKKGLLLINAALIAEADMGYTCNNNVILVKVDESIQNNRLLKRGLNKEQIQRRLCSQYDDSIKRKLFDEWIKRDHNGHVTEILNSIEGVDSIISQNFERVLDNYQIPREWDAELIN